MPFAPGPIDHQTASRACARLTVPKEQQTDMGVPKRKVAHARQMERRSHLAITLPKLVECPHCHEPKLSHRVCPACGWYNGRQAVEPKPVGAPGEESA